MGHTDDWVNQTAGAISLGPRRSASEVDAVSAVLLRVCPPRQRRRGVNLGAGAGPWVDPAGFEPSADPDDNDGDDDDDT